MDNARGPYFGKITENMNEIVDSDRFQMKLKISSSMTSDWSRSGKLFAYGTDHGECYVFDCDKNEIVWNFQNSHPVRVVKFPNDPELPSIFNS